MACFIVSKVFSANFAKCVLNLTVNSFNNFLLVLGLLYLGMFLFFVIWHCLHCGKIALIFVDQFYRLYYFFV